VCANSPFSATALQSILSTALTKLGSFSLSNPNPLIPNLNNPTKPSCTTNKAQGSLENCGYPQVWVDSNETAANPTWAGLFDNPSIYYGSAYTASTCKTVGDFQFPTDLSFQVREDEAIIWLGCTANDLKYFSYARSVVDESNTQTATNGLIGEALNELSIQTTSVSGSNFGAATLIIYAADQVVVDTITKAFTNAGFPASAINVQPWPVAEVSLGKDGKLTPQNSVLTVINRLYQFETSTAADYALCVQGLFPYVRLTPLFPRSLSKPIAQLESWLPEDSGASQSSEFGFGPVLEGLVQTIQSYANGVFVAQGFTEVSSYVSQAVRVQDFALKWILEKLSGTYGVRDANYNVFPVQTSTNYAVTEQWLNLSLVCGIDHTATFTTNVPTLSHVPIATYFNYAVYGLNLSESANLEGLGLGTDTGLAASLTVATPLDIALFPATVQEALAGEVFAKIGVAASTHFYCNFFSSDCALINELISAVPCAPVNTSIPNGEDRLAVVYRAYLNPITKTQPSDLAIQKPLQVAFNYFKAAA